MITLMVNGASRELAPHSTVGGLLGSLGIDPRVVVVEHNRLILRDRESYSMRPLFDGDVIEIVHFVGGG